jgi:eukaryotic-like serine/threonine-protein kinase
MPLSAGDKLGPYEIIALIGKGGMGEVYRARDLKLGRMAAIKVLPDALVQDAERRSRFQCEAKILAGLSHPNIAAVYGWDESGGTLALVMELVEGRPLDQAIPRKGMPLDEALQCAIQVARGLEAAHRAGVVHRDLKPSNVMLTSVGVVKLLDFGLAKLAAAPQPDSPLDETVTATFTQAGAIMGTVAYMSPEQAQGKPIDARSDLFSFGTMLFEMLTGERPFRGDNQASTLAAILREDPKAVSTLASVPHELDRVVGRCLRKSVERRFQTASDLRVALEELAEEASSGQLAAAAPAPVKRHRFWWTAGVAAIAALVATVYWMPPHSGSTLRPLRQLTFESGMALMPALSPDGRMLVYSSDRSGEGVLDLWIRQTAAGDPHRLTSGMGTATNPQFSPDGTKVLFLSGNSIFEIPAFSGPARRLAENAGPFTVSSRGEIAYVPPRTGVVQTIRIMSLQGSETHEWRSDCKSITPPGWSPDGSRLAIIGECGPEFGLYVVPRQGGAPARIPLPVTGNAQRELLPIASRVQWYRLAQGSSREELILPMRNGDSMNLYRIGLDGSISAVTQGTGWEGAAAVSGNGEMVFTRAEYLPTVWSMPLEGRAGAAERPRKEAAPAGLFGVSRDGAKLIFGRMAGLTKGELVSRELAAGTETVIATHELITGGIGSFWTHVSPDASQAIYRMNSNRGRGSIGHCLLSLMGGAPECRATACSAGSRESCELLLDPRFSLASGWRPDGTRVLGECEDGGICELNPADWNVRQIVHKPAGEVLLYPSYSWDGKWIAFMQRGGGLTAITMARVTANGTVAPRSEWVRISPAEVKAAARPRFSADGKLIFYIKNEGGVQHLVRQPVDLAAGRAGGPAVVIAPVQIFPAWFADSIGSPTSTVEVSKDRVYFNSVELRGNVWTTSLH